MRITFACKKSIAVNQFNDSARLGSATTWSWARTEVAIYTLIRNVRQIGHLKKELVEALFRFCLAFLLDVDFKFNEDIKRFIFNKIWKKFFGEVWGTIWLEIIYIYLKTYLTGHFETLFYEWKMRLETNKFLAHLDVYRKAHDIK